MPEDELQQANGLLAIARYAAFPLGAAIGGSIVVLVGTGAALLVDAGTYATSALLLSRIDVVSIARAGAGFLQRAPRGLERLRRADLGLGARPLRSRSTS